MRHGLLCLMSLLLLPSLVWAQCRDLRELTRQPDAWFVFCDGTRQEMTRQQYEALGLPGAPPVEQLCPDGTGRAVAVGMSAQFDTLSGVPEACTFYQFRAGPTQFVLFPDGTDRAIDTRVHAPTRDGGRITGFTPPVEGVISR